MDEKPRLNGQLVHYWNMIRNYDGARLTSWRRNCRWNTTLYDTVTRPNETDSPVTCLLCLHVWGLYGEQVCKLQFVFIRSYQ